MDLNSLNEMLEPLSPAERITTLVQLAKAADPDNRVFGASKHKYQLEPTTTVEAVREFEQEHGITMPEELVTYLTEIGNGGAGVDYGIYPIEKFICDEATVSEGMTLFDYKDPQETYLSKSKEMEALDEEYGDLARHEIDRLSSDLFRGMLVIGTAGCTYDYFIMLSGCKKGMIGMLDWNMIEKYSDTPRMYDMTLFEWLEDHFKRIILGKVIHRGSFDEVNYYKEDIGMKKRTKFVPKEEKKDSAEPAPPPAPVPTPPPAPVPTPPPAPVPTPPPAPVPTPPPAPVPTPPPAPAPTPVVVPLPKKRVFRVGEVINHKKYGQGFITNVVGNIITADYFASGPHSITLPYDEKDILD